MRIARFSHDDEVSYGLVLGPEGMSAEAPAVANGAAAAGQAGSAGSHEDGQLAVAQIAGHPFGAQADIKLTGARFPLPDVRLLAPILPSKVICIGKNYADHAREMGGEPPEEPVIFLKPSTAVCGPGDPILRPTQISDRTDYEGELAVVIGRLCRQVPADRVAEVIFGYTCANDVTARDLQAKDGQWTRAKGFDTFCPLGPWIETELDPSNLRIRGRLNGRTMQEASTSQMLFSVRSVISYLSRGMTLLPGTVLLTGTPAGVGFARKPPVWLKPGDSYEVEIEGIGALRNPVVADSWPAGDRS